MNRAPSLDDGSINDAFAAPRIVNRAPPFAPGHALPS